MTTKYYAIQVYTPDMGTREVIIRAEDKDQAARNIGLVERYVRSAPRVLESHENPNDFNEIT